MGIRRYYFLVLLLVPILISASINSIFALEQACPDCGGSQENTGTGVVEISDPFINSDNLWEIHVNGNGFIDSYTATVNLSWGEMHPDDPENQPDVKRFVARHSFGGGSVPTDETGSFELTFTSPRFLEGGFIRVIAQDSINFFEQIFPFEFEQFPEDVITFELNKEVYQKNDVLDVNGILQNPHVDATQHNISSDIRKNGKVVFSRAGMIDADGTFRTIDDFSLPAGEYEVVVRAKGIFRSQPMLIQGADPEPEQQIIISTSRSSYNEGETIVISGKVFTIILDAPLTVQIFNLGNLIEIVQLVVAQDGSFTTTILAEGGQWQNEGEYVVRASYGEGNIAETTFQFFKKDVEPEISGFFEVNAGSFGSFDVEYAIRGGDIDDMILDFSLDALLINIDTNADGFVELELPRFAIDAKKSDGSDDLFIVQIDGIEVNYDEAITNENTRTITIQFEEGDEDFRIIGNVLFPNEEPIPEPPPPGVDQIPPKLLMPADMIITGNDPDGTAVTYSVKAIDNFDQILNPKCDPPSGSIFPVGITIVRCSVTDSSRNTDTDSFKILVKFSEFVVPEWVKDVAGFWCNDEIDDASFVQAVQYLITSEVINVPSTESGEDGSEESNEVPAWIKNNACWWSQGSITDGDFVNGLQYLIGQGIIRV